MLNKRVQHVAALAVLFMAWAVGGSAQGTTGGVGGTLVDSSGLVLPGVAVTLSGPNLQGLRTVTTDGEGFYHFRAVPPGADYKVTAELSGFKPATRENIQVFLGQEGTVNLTLVPAGVTETVTVTASVPLVDTGQTSTGLNITANLFETLP